MCERLSRWLSISPGEKEYSDPLIGAGVCVWNICKDVKLHMLSNFSTDTCHFYFYLFTDFKLHTALWTFSWDSTCWFKLLKVLVSILRYTFSTTAKFSQFFNKLQGVPGALMRPALTKTLISCPWYGNGTLFPRTCHRTFVQAVTIRLFQVIQVDLHRFWYFRRPQEGLLWPLLRTSFNQLSNHFCYSECTSLQPSDVFHTSISQLVMHFTVLSFSIFHYLSESVFSSLQFFVTAIFRAVTRFSIFYFHSSTFQRFTHWYSIHLHRVVDDLRPQLPAIPQRFSLLLSSFSVSSRCKCVCLSWCFLFLLPKLEKPILNLSSYPMGSEWACCIFQGVLGLQ